MNAAKKLYLISKTLINKLFAKIDSNLIVFTSFNGKYADGPKAIANAIHNTDSSTKIVWLVNDIRDTSIPNYYTVVKYGSNKASKYISRAAGIVDNVYCGHEYYTSGDSLKSKIKFKVGTFLKQRNGQRYYTTWHGTPIKKIGSDSIRNKSHNFSCSNTTMFLDNKFTANIMRRITKDAIDIQLLGEPRNDVLFDKTINIQKYKKKLGIPQNKKAIIYAPTFRSNDDETKNIENSGVSQLKELDINKLLEVLSKKFGGEWVFIARFHYHVEKVIDWNKLKEKYGNKIINGNKSEDIMDYLVCCDALLTDISSCIFDFSLTGKPAFSFFPDYNHYVNDERGLYFKKEELPWNISLNANELYRNIEAFNKAKYKEDITTFYKKLGFTPNKPCAEKIAKYILDDIKNNEK